MNKTVIVIDSSIEPSYYIKWTDFYVTVPACAFSLVTTFISTVIFSHKEMNDTFSRFLLIICISDFSYMLFNLPAMVLRSWCVASPLLCGSVPQYVSIWYYYVSFFYLAGSLAMFSILTEIFLIIQRIFIILNKRYLKELTVYHMGPVIFFIAFIYYSPYWFARNVQPTGRVYLHRSVYYEQFALVSTNFGKSDLASDWLNVLSIIRVIIVICVIPVLNAITIIVFNRFLRRKAGMVARKQRKFNKNRCKYNTIDLFDKFKATNSHSTHGKPATALTNTPSSYELRISRNVTLMLIANSFVYIFGNLIQRLTTLNSLLGWIKDPYTLSILSYVGQSFLFAYPGLKSFVYLTFNKGYRRIYFRYLKVILCLSRRRSADCWSKCQ